MKVLLTISILFLYLTLANCQKKELYFEKMNGLSSPMITGMLLDRDGFLWIATWSGLNRYDGYSFKEFRAIEGNINSLCSNAVKGLVEDKKGRIWVATTMGLNLYDKKKDKFLRITFDQHDTCSISGNDLNTIALDSKGNLWLGTYVNGLCSLSVDNEHDYFIVKPRFKRYRHDPKISGSITSNFIQHFYEDRRGKLWINAGSTIVDQFNPESNTFNHFHLQFHESNTFFDEIHLLYQDSDSLYWFGTRGLGLISWNAKNNKCIVYKNIPGKNSISGNYIRHLREDEHGIFWISTDGHGISLFNRKTGQFNYCTSEPTHPGSLGSNAIFSTLADNTGGIWVATSNDGLYKYNAHKTNFHLFAPDRFNKNSLNNKLVPAILEDKEGNVWIGTDGGGLNVYYQKTGKFDHFINKSNDPSSISSNAVVCITEDYEGKLWVGTYGGGLCSFDKKKRKFCRYLYDKNNVNSISSNDIWSLLEDSKHNLWIGTLPGTLNRFDRKHGNFIRYSHDIKDKSSFVEAYTNCIFEDRRHYIWIGTSSGLDRFNLNTVNFDHPGFKISFTHFTHIPDKNSLSSSFITSIQEDYQGNMWFGAEDNGLNQLDMKTGVFHVYGDKEGLSEKSIRGILEDNEHNLWISTVNGLWKYNRNKKLFIRYDINDGLQDNNFKRGCFKSQQGILYFGGFNGFNRFNPSDFPINFKSPIVKLTGFKIFNSLLQPGQQINGNIILKKSITFTSELAMASKLNFFSIEFSALDFTNPGKNRYAYKLDGFDDQWHNTDSENRTATYTNLDPGEYIFRLKASNNDNIWTKSELMLSISILPPWWRTWWAKSGGILLLILLLYVTYRLRIAYFSKKHKELVLLVNQRTRELMTLNKQLTDRQLKIEQYAEELKIANEKLVDRQYIVENQSYELQKQTEIMIQSNAQLIEKQKLIQDQTEELQKTNQQLIKLNSTKDKFFSIIAHDLKNPFHVVMGFSDLLLEEYQNITPEKIKKFLGLINTSSKTGNALLDNLLQWSRSQSGKITFEPINLNLVTLCEEALMLLEGDAQQKKILIHIKVDPFITVFADENMLKTIIRNLVSNAIKFSFTGGIIAINASIFKSYVEISVSDSGVGINNEQINKLFDLKLNSSTKGTANESGTGLGLIICKEFIELHQGSISVKSVVNQGSKFIINLPLY